MDATRKGGSFKHRKGQALTVTPPPKDIGTDDHGVPDDQVGGSSNSPSGATRQPTWYEPRAARDFATTRP